MNSNHTTFRSIRLSALFFLLALAPTPGCDGDEAGSPETGDITLSVSSIPDNVACIRVIIAGEFRTVTSDFDVTPGGTLAESFSGLPVGAVAFSANAYAQACASVGKSTVPMWLAEDKTANVVQGRSTSVNLVLLKNGRAKVTVEFGDQEDGGSPGRTSTDAGAGG